MPTSLYSKTARGYFASEKVHRDLRVAALASFVSSFFMLLSVVFLASGFTLEWEGNTHLRVHQEEYQALNATLIARLWQDRRRALVRSAS